MQKPAPTDHPIHNLLSHRWSPRAFDSRPIPADVLRSLFEAARWAPSSNNEQPWAYLVATKDHAEEFAKMTSVLVEFNANWAKNAPLLALAVYELAFAKNGAPNRNGQYDTGAATALLVLLPEWLRFLADWRLAAFGAMLILVLLTRPQGILDRPLLGLLRRRSKPS